MNGSVAELALYKGDLIVAGSFTAAGGLPASKIACWDGQHWSSLGSGIGPSSGVVSEMAVYQGRLIVGGKFNSAGGLPANSIAQWDGVSWSALGSGVSIPSSPDLPSGSVSAITVYNGELTVGGSFTNAGGVDANSIAKWNPAGAGSWSALEEGVSSPNTPWLPTGTVLDLAVYQGELIVGGSFSIAGHQVSFNWSRWGPDDNNTTDTDADGVLDSCDACPGTAEGRIVDATGCGFVTLDAAASRRTHGAAGTFDIQLPLAGPAAVEPRRNGTAPQIVLTFSDAIEAADGELDCGQEVLLSNGNCQSLIRSGNTLTVDATFTANTCVQITVSGLRAANGGPGMLGSQSVQMTTHEGDVNANGAVNILDLQAIKNELNQPVTASNFELDVNVNGSINILDLQAVKNNLNRVAACP